MLYARTFREAEAEVWSSLPPALRRTGEASVWAQANLQRPVDSFLEGPCFTADGGVLLVDIPFGRILAFDGMQHWRVVAEYDGWPNGLKLASPTEALVTDYRRGLVAVSLADGRVQDVLTHRYSEGFRGLNDLTQGPDGTVYLTDQGQSGLHDPGGRVLRWQHGRLDVLLAGLPSPNGVVLDPSGTQLFVAMTRDNAIWRVPLQPDGGISKVGRFITLSGGTGPDGIAMDSQGRLYVAHIGLGCVWQFNRRGEALRRFHTPGDWPTNVALSADERRLVITEAQRGELLRCELAD